MGSENGLGDTVTFNAGSRATLWAHASDSSPNSPLKLDTYVLAFQVGNTTTIPTNFSNFSVDFSQSSLISNAAPAGFGLFLNVEADPVPGHNLIVSNTRGDGLGLTVTGNRSKLFSISFDIGQATVGGTYRFGFVPEAQQNFGPVNVVLGEGFPEPLGTSSGMAFNQFNVTAVPEPSSLVLACLAAGILGWRSRKRGILE